jgi:hypothetical protein
MNYKTGKDGTAYPDKNNVVVILQSMLAKV